MSDFDDRQVKRADTCEFCQHVYPLAVYFEYDDIHEVEPFCMLGVSKNDLNYIREVDTEDRGSYSPRFLDIMRLGEADHLGASCRRTCMGNSCQFFKDQTEGMNEEEEQDA